MADADEDHIAASSVADAEDLEDTPQDFRFLAQLTSSQSSLPKRGTKDFEPNPTRAQARTLDDSRRAMHDALSAVRVHSAGKGHLVATYIDDEDEWRWDSLDLLNNRRRNARCVVCYRFGGTHLKTMGLSDSQNWTWFLPEEALWLLERGSLDVRWRDPGEQGVVRDDDDGNGNGSSSSSSSSHLEDECGNGDGVESKQDSPGGEPHVGQLPMSLQGAYAAFIGKDGLTLERYQVYANLKRIGYIVNRAPSWYEDDPPRSEQAEPAADPTTLYRDTLAGSRQVSPESTPLTAAASLIYRLCSYLFIPRRGPSCPAFGPLVAPGLYRNYADIFRSLALIPYHDPLSGRYISVAASPSPSLGNSACPLPAAVTTAGAAQPIAPFRVAFHIHKPSALSSFRKTAPLAPDYRVVVISARDTSLPSLAEVSALLDAQPLDESNNTRLENRVKHGKRNVIVAVVDSGIVSYLRVADAGFGGERLYTEKTTRGTKGGRRGKGKTPAFVATS